MKNFRKKILKIVDVPVDRISFRKDKWGELATVYFARTARAVSIGDDYDKSQMESFLHSVKNGSKSFVSEAKKVYGKDWKNKIKHRS